LIDVLGNSLVTNHNDCPIVTVDTTTTLTVEPETASPLPVSEKDIVTASHRIETSVSELATDIITAAGTVVGIAGACLVVGYTLLVYRRRRREQQLRSLRLSSMPLVPLRKKKKKKKKKKSRKRSSKKRHDKTLTEDIEREESAEESDEVSEEEEESEVDDDDDTNDDKDEQTERKRRENEFDIDGDEEVDESSFSRIRESFMIKHRMTSDSSFDDVTLTPQSSDAASWSPPSSPAIIPHDKDDERWLARTSTPNSASSLRVSSDSSFADITLTPQSSNAASWSTPSPAIFPHDNNDDERRRARTSTPNWTSAPRISPDSSFYDNTLTSQSSDAASWSPLSPAILPRANNDDERWQARTSTPNSTSAPHISIINSRCETTGQTEPPTISYHGSHTSPPPTPPPLPPPPPPPPPLDPPIPPPQPSSHPEEGVSTRAYQYYR